MSKDPAKMSDPKLLAGTLAEVTATTAPMQQLGELPKDELKHLAEDFGLEPEGYKSRQHLVAAIHDRRQLIAALDREAMIEVVKWGRRPVASNATKEQIAQEIARIKSMRFDGLGPRGLLVLARLRGVQVRGDEGERALIRKLKKQEGMLARFGRKRRAMLGALVSSMLGEADGDDYQFLPPQQALPAGSAAPPPSRAGSIKEEIEESGLFGGIAGRIKREADVYLNQKLDEIESRIDRKLDDIDRRLTEWRDKEIANRIRILKITLWASVIVAGLSLVYSYVKVYFVDKPLTPTEIPLVRPTSRPGM